jgi:hypothetical protein
MGAPNPEFQSIAWLECLTRRAGYVIVRAKRE